MLLVLGLLSRKAEVGARNITTAVVHAQDSYEVSSPVVRELKIVLVRLPA